MITQPALCPTGSTFWNKTPKSQFPMNRISSSFFFAPHLPASLKAIECSTGPFDRTNISKLNFASGRTAGLSSSTLVKLSLSAKIAGEIYWKKISSTTKRHPPRFIDPCLSPLCPCPPNFHPNPSHSPFLKCPGIAITSGSLKNLHQ